jgi:hypothetical protein
VADVLSDKAFVRDRREEALFEDEVGSDFDF